jgi:alpha-beta hydrolase superfamily lysophospholipase
MRRVVARSAQPPGQAEQVLDGVPNGAAVFLHGLTDSPCSLRHIARHYHERGCVAVAIKLPTHGTVPGRLADVEWEDWLAATRPAVSEAWRRAGPPAPLHLVGFSNGGALALKYALDAIEDPGLARPDRIVARTSKRPPDTTAFQMRTSAPRDAYVIHS